MINKATAVEEIPDAMQEPPLAWLAVAAATYCLTAFFSSSLLRLTTSLRPTSTYLSHSRRELLEFFTQYGCNGGISSSPHVLPQLPPACNCNAERGASHHVKSPGRFPAPILPSRFLYAVIGGENHCIMKRSRDARWTAMFRN